MPAIEQSRPSRENWYELPELIGYTVAVWATIWLSFRIGVASNEVVAIWPLAGLGVWIAFRHGWKSLPVLFAGQIAHMFYVSAGFDPLRLMTATGNVIACYLPVRVFLRLHGNRNPLRTINGVLLFIGIVATGMSALSAAVGCLALSLFLELPSLELWKAGWRWFFSDFTGVLLISPILLACHKRRNQSWQMTVRNMLTKTYRPLLGSVLMVATLYLITFIFPKGVGQYSVVLLTMPFCIWLAFQDQHQNTIFLLTFVTISSLALTLVAVGNVTETAFIAVQLYGVVIMATSLVMHASTLERREALKALDEERELLERKVAQRTAKLKELAESDALTGLANRRRFEERLQTMFEARPDGALRHYLAAIDLDQFKIVNDNSGHAAGDELLRIVANTLRENCDEEDVIGRLGGDEFALILRHRTAAQAAETAEAIRRTIEALRFRWDDQQYAIGASIGVVALSRTQDSIDDAMQMADAACYRAKNNGRNRVHMPADNDPDLDRHCSQPRWAQRLNDAIDEDLFVLHGQRIKPTGGDPGPVKHIEVLLRMRDPVKRELVSPDAFLPAADHYGLATKVDQWVICSLIRTLYLHQAFDAKRQQYWINLSGSSVGDERFVDFLIEQMSNSPIEPGVINFEITETAVIRNINEAGRLMGKLHDLGCKFALDDFGTGVSSFSHLKLLPVDYVKIDGMFIRDIVNNRVDQIFVKSIIDIAHAMDIKTVAEFVTCEAVEQTVTELGVDFVQGHAIDYPNLLTPEFSPLTLLQKGMA